MKVQVTVVVSDGHHAAQVGSTTMLLTPGRYTDDQDVLVANAARSVARKLGLGKPTPEREGGRAR